MKLCSRVLLTALLVGGMSLTAQAGQKDIPSPYQGLKEALQGLNKTASFRFTFEAVGGLANDASRTTPDEKFVQRAYDIEVYRPLMKVADPQSFGIYGTDKGATFDRSSWRTLFSNKKTKEIPFLCRPPEVVLKEALQYAKKDGVWLDEGQSTETWRPTSEEVSQSTTVARSDSGLTEEGTVVLPTKLRVIGPAKEAVERTTMVQTSGCLGGG